jgi:hypothetical protein
MESITHIQGVEEEGVEFMHEHASERDSKRSFVILEIDVSTTYK